MTKMVEAYRVKTLVRGCFLMYIFVYEPHEAMRHRWTVSGSRNVDAVPWCSNA